MSFPTFDQLEWAQRLPSDVYDKPSCGWVGWDTETMGGDIGLICRDPQYMRDMDPAQQENAVVQLEKWHEWAPRSVVDARTILQQMFHPGWHGVWWNLKYDIECILKQLDENLVKGLIKGQKIDVDGYRLHYIPGKRFTLKRGNHTTHHFDFADFYHTSLDEAAKRFLNDSKTLTSLTRSELGSSWDVWEPHKEELIEYCYHDARLTRRLAQLWYEWAQDFGVDASYPISPANVAGRHALIEGVPDYPEQFHETVGKAAWEAYYGGRFETRKKGWFDELWGIDIKSAYPAVMVDLPSTECTWYKTEKEQHALTYPWGFVKAEIKIDPGVDWAPLMHRKPDGLVYGPVGALGEKWITLDEYRICYNDTRIRTSFVKAWVGEDNGQRPFAWLEDIYNERAKLKAQGDPRELVLKLLINGVYGKTLQRSPIHDVEEVEEWDETKGTGHNVILVNGKPFQVKKNRYKIGPLFNPIYASTITARTRCQLWEMMQKYETAIVMTDGILIQEKPDKQDLGSELGDWEIDSHGEGVIIGNGMYQVGDKRSKRRGFQVPERFSGWIDALQDCPPDAEQIVIDQRRPLHPGEVLIRNDYDLTDVGAFVDMSKCVHFNRDRKRDFPTITAETLLTENVEGSCVTL